MNDSLSPLKSRKSVIMQSFPGVQSINLLNQKKEKKRKNNFLFSPQSQAQKKPQKMHKGLHNSKKKKELN